MRRLLLAALLFAVGAAPAAAEDASPAERQAEFAKLPYWSGLWIPENDETTIGGLPAALIEARDAGQASDPRNRAATLWAFAAPWNEEGKRRRAEVAKLGGNRTADGWGYPMMMNAAAPLQFIISPEVVIIINAYRDIRHIRTDGQPHPAPDDLWPTVWGDSIGHWEGDTLVIDTIQVSNPDAYFHGSPTLSEDAHYVERLRMVSPTRIEGEITITDPTTLTKPWVVPLVYVRDDSFGRLVYDTFTNNRTDTVNETIAPPKDEAPAEGE